MNMYPGGTHLASPRPIGPPDPVITWPRVCYSVDSSTTSSTS
jgi:hypothetical protein